MAKGRLAELDRAHADVAAMLRKFAGRVLDEELCRRFAYSMAFDIGDVPPLYLQQSLLQYVGRRLEPEWCDRIARQCVARSADLKEGPLSPYELPVRTEWLDLEIQVLKPCEWRDGATGRILVLYALTGHPAGSKLTLRIPESWLAWLAYQIGFTKRIKYEYEPDDFIGLRLRAFLDKPEPPKLINFTKWDVDKEIIRYNQRLILTRRRFSLENADKYPCPLDFDHYCQECDRRAHQCFAAYDRRRFDADTAQGNDSGESGRSAVSDGGSSDDAQV